MAPFNHYVVVYSPNPISPEFHSGLITLKPLRASGSSKGVYALFLPSIYATHRLLRYNPERIEYE